MTQPLITVDGISVRQRDRWLLNGSSWRINSGEQWTVVGPNGAGKTTLAKAIAGLLPVVQGKIHYHQFADIAPVKAIAYVASDFCRHLWRRERNLDHGRFFSGRYDDSTTVRQLIGGPLVEHVSLCDAYGQGVDVLARINLDALLDKPVLAVSTGEMSRVLIARELVRQPKMLILDEPFQGLDESGRQELIVMLDQLADEGLPMILISHRREEIIPATTHVLTLDQGRIVGTQPVQHATNWLDTLTAGAFERKTKNHYRQVSAKGQQRRPMRSGPLIDMRSVTVRYGDTTVLDRFTWRMLAGEHWAITGPNGAGKSTVLKLINGDCLQVYANRIRLFGKDRGPGQTLWDIREKLGVVSHDLAAGYQKQMSALDVVCSGFFDSIGLYQDCDARQIDRALRGLDQMGLSGLSQTPFNQLSQGQRQLILIARAMVKLPRLLILDEPCAGLDPENRRMVLELVAQIGRGGATALIFVSHHEKEIPTCMTHRLALDHGTVVHRGVIDSR